MHAIRPTFVLALAVVAAGCAAPAVAPAPAVTTGKASAGIATQKATVEGLVTAPAGLVAAGGGNLVGMDGSTLVAAGGGNLVAAGGLNYALQQAQAEPFAGAEIVVTDGLGKPIAGVARVKTGKDGRYKIVGVPITGAFAVQAGFKTADGKNAGTLMTLAEANGRADISASTTCVAVRLLGEKGKPVKGFDGASFQKAVGLIDKASATDAPPPLWDRSRIVGWMGKLEDKVDGLKGSLAAIDARLDSIEAKLDELLARASAAPSAEPSAAASSAPLVTSPVTEPGGTPATTDTKGQLWPLAPIAGATAAGTDYGSGSGLSVALPHDAGAWVGLPDGVAKIGPSGAAEKVVILANNQLQPRAIAADASGNAWIADAYSYAAVKVTADGKVFRTDPTGYGTPVGIATATDESVWLTSADLRINHYAPDGKLLETAKPDQGADLPGAIACGFDDRVWVAYPTRNEVVTIENTGKILTRVAVGYPTGHFAEDGRGKLWIAGRDGIVRIDPATGEVVSSGATAQLYVADDQGVLWYVEGSTLKRFMPDVAGAKPAEIALSGTPKAIWPLADGRVQVLYADSTVTYPR